MISKQTINTLASSVIDAYDLLMNDPDLAEETKDRIGLIMIGMPELATQVLEELAAPPTLPPVTLHTVPLLRAKGYSIEGGD